MVPVGVEIRQRELLHKFGRILLLAIDVIQWLTPDSTNYDGNEVVQLNINAFLAKTFHIFSEILWHTLRCRLARKKCNKKGASKERQKD